MKSLVIGATSLSGQFMTKYLDSIGEEYIGTGLASEIDNSNFGNNLIPLDLLDYDNLKSIISELEPDYIFNFVAQSSVSQSWIDPYRTVDLNIVATINLFESIRAMNKKPVVLIIGAGEEYGRLPFDKMPINEIETINPNNIYAVTRACQTMISRIYHQAYGLRIIVARTFNIIGPGQSTDFVISDLCKQAILMEIGKQDKVLDIGNVNVKRDFTDIRDLVKAFWLLVNYGKFGEIYNVGSGNAISILDVLKEIKNKVAFGFDINVQENRLRKNDVPILVGDISKIVDDTKWKPSISIEESINDMLQYWRNLLNQYGNKNIGDA